MRRDGRHQILRLLVVQDDVFLSVGEDLFDGLIAVPAQHQSQPARLHQPLVADAFAQGEDALAGFVGLFRIPARTDDVREVVLDGLPDGGALVQKDVRIPFQVLLLGLGEVVRIRRIAVRFRAQRMLRYALELVVDENVPAVVVKVDLLPDQLDGDAVEMLFEADVSVLLDRGDAPFLDLEADRVQWPHAGALDLLVLFPPAVVPAREFRVVVNLQRHPDRRVQPLQIVELLVFHQRVNRPVDQLDGALDQRLVLRASDPGRKGRASVVIREGGEVFVQLGLILVRMGDGRLEVIRHDDLGRSSVEVEGILTRVDEILLLLARHRFDIGEL